MRVNANIMFGLFGAEGSRKMTHNTTFTEICIMKMFLNFMPEWRHKGLSVGVTDLDVMGYWISFI